LGGSVRLALGQEAEGGTLFVIARATPTQAGPPLAVKKLTWGSGAIGMLFTLTERDLMMGGVWPEQVWLHARLDADGDPLTKGKGDWVSELLGPFESGAPELTVVLQPVE
jgi:hypothetical protein